MRDVWSIGGRAGWAFGNWMPYVTGGYANGNFQMTTVVTGESASERQGGAYLGGGLDWLIMKNVVFGIEYRHYDFGHRTTYSQAPGVCAGAGTGVDSAHCELIQFNPKADTIAARLSFFFNPPLR